MRRPHPSSPNVFKEDHYLRCHRRHATGYFITNGGGAPSTNSHKLSLALQTLLLRQPYGNMGLKDSFNGTSSQGAKGIQDERGLAKICKQQALICFLIIPGTCAAGSVSMTFFHSSPPPLLLLPRAKATSRIPKDCLTSAISIVLIGQQRRNAMAYEPLAPASLTTCEGY
ncbi:hypothetical protein Tco_1545921 [Tanacetum coccineum]